MADDPKVLEQIKTAFEARELIIEKIEKVSDVYYDIYCHTEDAPDKSVKYEFFVTKKKESTE